MSLENSIKSPGSRTIRRASIKSRGTGRKTNEIESPAIISFKQIGLKKRHQAIGPTAFEEKCDVIRSRPE